MMMPGRGYQAKTGYRYGFNGKENDNEVMGGGNSLDFGARVYEPRLGRWLSVDPLQQKYASFSPYNYAMSNPIFYYDVDGRDVGVTITRNPQGGGTITFYSTTYVTGIDAEQKVQLYNAAFKQFVEANPGMKTTDGKWSVELRMEFKAATADDVKRITSNAQEMAAENMMNIKAESKNETRAHSGMPVPSSNDKPSISDPKGNNGKGLRIANASGRFTQVYTKDGGRTAVHEELHNWGLGDYYADAEYTWEMVDNKTGKVEKTGKLEAKSYSYAGMEGTIMAGGGDCMAQQNLDDLVNTALKVSAEKGSNSFIMGREVDGNRPHNRTRVDQLQPVLKVEKTPTKTTTYKNPVYKNAGN